MRTSQCDRKRIEDFFRNELADSDTELTHHLETCAECRLYFDAQAAQPNLWLEAQQMLKPCEFDQAGSAEFSGISTKGNQLGSSWLGPGMPCVGAQQPALSLRDGVSIPRNTRYKNHPWQVQIARWFQVSPSC